MTADVDVTVNDSKSVKPKSIFGFRHVQVALLFFAMLIAYTMRVNMSMAIVAMTDANSDNTFNWSMQTQSVILSSFSWGYFILQIPAGELITRFGGSIFLTIVVAGNAAISLLIPSAAYYVRAELGTALQLSVSGFIVDYWGWPGIFYVNGTLGAIWTVAYIFLGAASPQNSKIISNQEKLYIQNSLGQIGEQKILKTPWKAIGKSVPFYALIIAQCGHSWGFWTLMTEMPSYMKQILDLDIKTNGVMSALPYLSMCLLGFPFGFISDYVLKKKWLNINAARKISNTIGECGPAFALIGLSYVPSGNITLAVALLCIGVGLNAGYYTGFLMVHIDMAPNFASTLMGISNCLANAISIIPPIVAGLILQDESEPSQWRQVFYLASAIYIAANIIFVVFGTSERQSWNEPKQTNDGKQYTDKL